MIDKLKQLEQRAAGLWPGYKTKLILILNAIAPLAGFVGYSINPEAVTAYVEEGGQALLALQAALIGLAAWARRLTNVYSQLTARQDEDVPVDKKKRGTRST